MSAQPSNQSSSSSSNPEGRTSASSVEGNPDIKVEAAPIKPPSGPLGGLRSSSLREQPKRASTSSNSNSNSNSNNGAAAEPGQNPRARLKYQPKAGIARRTKEERDSLNAKFQAPDGSEATGGGGTRGTRGHRGHRGRGRGGAPGDRGRRQDEPLYASGPFSGGNAWNVPGGNKRIGPGGGSYGYSSTRRSAAARSNMKVKREGGGGDGDMEMEDLSASSDEESKVDVERIDLVIGVGADQDEEGERKESVALPVRIARREHVDRNKMSGLGSGDLTGGGGGGGGKSSDKGKQKQEVPDPPDAKKPLASVKERKEEDADGESKKFEPKFQKLSIQTAEDLEELDRIREDRASLLKELGPEDTNTDEDKAMADVDSKPPLNHGLYLFQFPPAMPRLISQDQAEKDKEALLSNEDRKIDLTKEEEPKGTEFPRGVAGKLRVHKSGRVSLLWGGIEFEVHKGLECDFLQEVVAVEKFSAPSGSGEQSRSKATSLGQLKGKYVISPDIGQLLA